MDKVVTMNNGLNISLSSHSWRYQVILVPTQVSKLKTCILYTHVYLEFHMCQPMLLCAKQQPAHCCHVNIWLVNSLYGVNEALDFIIITQEGRFRQIVKWYASFCQFFCLKSSNPFSDLVSILNCWNLVTNWSYFIIFQINWLQPNDMSLFD